MARDQTELPHAIGWGVDITLAVHTKRLVFQFPYLLVAAGSGSTRSPLRGNSSRGVPWVPGRGGSRKSSPEVPLGSSGSIGGCVCMSAGPRSHVVGGGTSYYDRNQDLEAETLVSDVTDNTYRPIREQAHDATVPSLRTLIEPRSIGRVDCKTTIIVRSAVIPPNVATFS
jgi:hypothetical protein